MDKIARTSRGHSPASWFGVWTVLVATMFASAQTWFWTKKASEFGDIVIAEFDKYGPFYWNALVCFVILVCLGALAIIWLCIAQHLLEKLRTSMFPSMKRTQ